MMDQIPWINFIQLTKEVIILIIPLSLSGILHMIVVKNNILSQLNIPLHKKMFGANKTWRGILVMPLFTVAGVYLGMVVEKLLFQNGRFPGQISFSLYLVNPLILGLGLGLAYVLAELPNSWMKRRLEIPAGELPAKNKFFFLVLDQVDSAFGCLIIYAIFFPQLSAYHYLFCLFFGLIIHLGLNYFLFLIGVRKRPC